MEENIIKHESRETQSSGHKQIAGAIVLAGILIAGAILLKGTIAPQANGPTATDTNYPAAADRPVSSQDHIIGNANAKVVIVEYSDFECPFCKAFHNTMHRIIDDNKGTVAWVYRNYPIPQLHPKAFHEAEASECAAEQGGNDAFWKFADRIFEVTPSNNGLDVAELPKIAQYIGLNVATFNTCLESGKFKDKIQSDIDNGNKAGVNGTPSSFILVKGKVVDTIPGALPYEAVTQKISAIK